MRHYDADASRRNREEAGGGGGGLGWLIPFMVIVAGLVAAVVGGQGGIASWLIFSGLVGWIAGLITGTNTQGIRGILMNVVVGLTGTFIGSFLAAILGFASAGFQVFDTRT